MALPPPSIGKYSDMELEMLRIASETDLLNSKKDMIYGGRYLSPAPSPKPRPSPNMIEMISMRMKWDGPVPFAFLAAHKINSERVVVFIVHKEQAVMVEDDGNLFPSDALITKLRLILG